MVKAIVYYFSGTGNSLMLARSIAEGLQGSLIPIASVVDKKRITSDAEVIGMVFPVYYGGLPVIVKEFAEKLDDLEGRYVFAVCTYGGAAGSSLRLLKRIIRSHGGELSGAYGVHMVQNAFFKPWENRKKLYGKAKRKGAMIAQKALERKRGRFYGPALINVLLTPLHVMVKPLTRRYFVKISGGSKDDPLETLIHESDRSFSSDERCTGCGLCVKVCPVNNIKLVEGKPVWLHHCENCLACYNWCPSQAILTGIAKEGYYYHHPDVKVADIME